MGQLISGEKIMIGDRVFKIGFATLLGGSENLNLFGKFQ